MVVKQHCVWVRKHRPPQDPICLASEDALPPERGGKERFGAAGQESLLLAVVGMSLVEPQGLWEPKPRVPPTLCTGTAGGKAEGVRISMGCGWRMASSPTVSFLPTCAQNDTDMGCLWCGHYWSGLGLFFLSCEERKRSLFVPVLLFLSLSTFFLAWIFPSLPVSPFSSAVSAVVLVMSTDPPGCCTLQFLELHLFIFVLGTKMVKIA